MSEYIIVNLYCGLLNSRVVDAKVIRKRAGMVPRRGERAEEYDGWGGSASLGKIVGLKHQFTLLFSLKGAISYPRF